MAGRLSFELSPSQVAIRNVLTNKSFIEIEIYAISNANPNRNASHFTIESMESGIDTFVDKPILGFFNRGGDFEQHNGKPAYDVETGASYWDNSNGEQILGFIREKDTKEIVEKEGLSWIRCTAMVYTQYNFKQVKRLLKDRKKKVSVEVQVLESEVIDGIEHIYKFELLGVTILGSKNGIPISEGIEGAHLSVLDMIETSSLYNQRQALAFAYAELSNEEDVQMAEEEFDVKKSLRVNKSKEAMSDSDWGEVDKTALRNRVVEADNFKTVAKDVFLDLREGWEEGETSKLKYPVMQLMGSDEVVYNRGGLASAKGYAEKNGDEEVLDKLKTIYKDLGLEETEERECDTSQFCEFYEDSDQNADTNKGHDDDEQEDKDEDEGEEEEKSEDGSNKKDSEEDKADDKSNNSCQMSQSEDGGEDELDEAHYSIEAQCAELIMKCDEYEKRCVEYEARCEEYEKRCAAYEEACSGHEEELAKYSDYDEIKKELENSRVELEAMRQKEKDKMKGEQLAHLNLLSRKMGLTEEDVKEVSAKCCEFLFNSLEEIDREVAYISWKKNYTNQEEDMSRFAVDIVENTPVKSSRGQQSVQERLKKNLKK